jgi:hypothetical protein
MCRRALLLDRDNVNLRYNFACSPVSVLHDFETVLDLLVLLFERMRIEVVNWVKADPDLDVIRDHHPCFGGATSSADRGDSAFSDRPFSLPCCPLCRT